MTYEICKNNNIDKNDILNCSVENIESLRKQLIIKQLVNKNFDEEQIEKINLFCKKLNFDNINDELVLALSGKDYSITISALEILTEKRIKDLGVTYSNFENNKINIIFDNYNIKLYDNELSIKKHNKDIDVGDLLINGDNNIKEIFNLLENLRIEKELKPTDICKQKDNDMIK